MKYINLSSEYVLRMDPNGAYLLGVSRIGRDSKASIIQIPFYMGIIFSLIGAEPYEKAILTISKKTGLSQKAVSHFVTQLINAQTSKSYKISDNYAIIFPKDILTYSDTPEMRDFYVESVSSDLLRPFELTRPTMPTSINLMTTVACSTDCVYCYANRKLKNPLDSEEIIQLLKYLKKEGAVNVTLTGGDIFAFDGWRKILAEIKTLQYNHFISTKTPLIREDIGYLVNLGYDSLQFSLDSSDPAILSMMVNVEGEKYIRKVIEFLNSCSENGIKVQIRSVLTNLNSNIKDIESLYEFLCGFECVSEWDMTPAFFSEYKMKQSEEYKVSNKDLSQIYDFSKRSDLKIPIRISKISKEGYRLKKYPDVESFCNHNQICLANYTTLSILANGVCSLCEMLYENEEYILGDIRQQTVKEIWNSPKALSLYAPLQETISSDSPCHKCRVFQKCKASHDKRICYLNIHKTGKSSDFPDPACPVADDSCLIL